MRIVRRLQETGGGLSLAALLPEGDLRAKCPNAIVRERSRWTSTLIAGLELAKQQVIRVEQTPASVELPFFLLIDGLDATAASSAESV